MKNERKKKFYLHTFGCQMNFHDSEKMAALLAGTGMEEAASYSEADVVVFNTCSIRDKAEQKFFSELGRLKKIKKKKPELKIAVAGCIAQQMGTELFERAGHVDFVLGPQNLHMIPRLAEGRVGEAAVQDNPDLPDMELPALRKDKPRAWISIMYGCDNFCTYCIVPYTRGREVSRPSGSILKEVLELDSEGFREITLLGQNVNSYKSDTSFPGLLEKLDGCTRNIRRIRFVTSHPVDLSDGLIDAIAELEKVCEHMHLPLQSGSDRVLGAMNRRYGLELYMRKIEKLRRSIPGIAITTDIIAGFPGETDEDHEKTVRALREVGFDGIFAFKYSSRPGTRAASLDGHLPEEVKAERLKEIFELQNGITLEKNRALEGSLMEVLVEGPSGRETPGDGIQLGGRTRTNKIVNFHGPTVLTGLFASVRIKKAGMHSLEGELA